MKAAEDTGITRRQFVKASVALAAGVVGGAGAATAAQPASSRILLKGGVVLTFDTTLGDFEKADVLIEGQKIVEIKPQISASAAVIDASKMIVLPGFIDSHHHNYQGALRNIQTNGLLEDYSRDIVGEATPYYRPEDAYVGELVSAIRALDAGITTLMDISQVSNSPEHSDACVKGLHEAGIRAVFAYARGFGPKAQYPQDIERLQKKYFSTADQLLTLALGTQMIQEQWTVARKAGVRIFTHVVGRANCDTILKWSDAGLAKSDNVYIHGTGASPEFMKMIAATGAALSIASPIEMTMRHGMPPLQLAIENSVRPSLSSDVETTMAADMFTQMRSVFTLQRALINERAIGGEKNLPPMLTAREVVGFATVEGAKCLALDRKIGTLSPGKEADIVMLRTDLPNVLPFNNAYGAIVAHMDTSNVDTVIVAGRVMKRHGKLVGVDIKRVAALADQSRNYIIGKVGWPRSVIDTSRPGR
jgi:cytosine/adenosine deaminase-related metal-dependent hydrolase